MSALAVVATRAAAPDTAGRVRRMLAAMVTLGDVTESSEGKALHSGAGATVGASAHAWERAMRGGASGIATQGSLVCVADATLYHREDLRRAIGGGRASAATTGDAALILDAYAAFGVDAFARLEGEFACVIVDDTRRCVIAARDFAGQRPLFRARAGDALLLASSVAGLLTDTAVPRDLDVAALARIAAGLWSHAPGTAYRAVEEVPAGHVLTWSFDGTESVAAFWHGPDSIMRERQPIAEAAEELRALLVAAVRERLGPEGPTAISLSGGWDSTAVGGAATLALHGDRARRLQPISISYPTGDPGREDELIRDVASHWGLEARWLDVDGIQLFESAEAGAATRDLPFAHTYEQWNRALARAGRASGARVMLDGVGGDQLFQVSDIFLSDLFGGLHWAALARQFRAREGYGLRELWRWAIRPALPPAIPRLAARMRGMTAPQHHLHRAAPFWFTARFLATHALVERDEAAAPALPGTSRLLGETHAFLRFPFFARITSTLRRFALEEGVLLRSPLLDDRVVRFAARRPWHERADGRETKLVLRRAMEGVVPAHVLAPRPRRTGITSAYFLRQLRGPGRPLIESLLKEPLLASLGMIDVPRLRHAWGLVQQHDDDELGVRLFFTLQAELWLRAHNAGAPVIA